ncbi:hypothetical protein Sjap_007734 [Stephania japonica]|uniref:Uncharacterized protein n=1 Tax=Stephania japonica TaxID=461633 RepID=A0AAP0PDZ1_9MAGN
MQELVGLLGADDQGELIDNSRGDRTEKMIGGDILPDAQALLFRTTLQRGGDKALAAQMSLPTTVVQSTTEPRHTPAQQNILKVFARALPPTGEKQDLPPDAPDSAKVIGRKNGDVFAAQHAKEAIIKQQLTIERHVVSNSEESNGLEHLLEEDQLAQINSENWKDERVLETPNPILKEREEAHLRGIIETEIISITTLMAQRELLGLFSLGFEPLLPAKILSVRDSPPTEGEASNIKG